MQSVAKKRKKKKKVDVNALLEGKMASHQEKRDKLLFEQITNVRYDLMEFNDLLQDDRFIESYNKISSKKGMRMQPRVKQNGYYFELLETAKPSRRPP